VNDPSPTNRAIRVLLIDDSELALQAISRVLTAAGMEVHIQEIAVGAIANLKRLNIDVAIVDVHLPQITGDQFVTLLRKTPALDSVRVVMITGEENEAALSAIGAQVKADAILPKSRIGTDLVKIVQELVPRTRVAAKRKYKVLIVDDDNQTAQQTKDWLTMLGHDVNLHDKPMGTLAAVMSQRPDILLLEVSLPLIGGEEIAGVLRKNRLLSNVQVIFYSSMPALELSNIAARNQALGSICKGGDARSFAQQFKELTNRGS
jgi:DNA-binding response OmpR family regulator